MSTEAGKVEQSAFLGRTLHGSSRNPRQTQAHVKHTWVPGTRYSCLKTCIGCGKGIANTNQHNMNGQWPLHVDTKKKGGKEETLNDWGTTTRGVKPATPNHGRKQNTTEPQ